MITIPIARPLIGEEEIQAVTDVMKTGQLAQGETVTQFENDFSRHFGHKSAAAISNGTVAIHTALKAAGVKSGDIVLTTPFTFVATSNAILYCNAIPVFVDIDEKTYNISPDAIRKAAMQFPEARYLLLVHLFGQACKMDEIELIAKEFSLIIIEDCAQAHGAKYNSKPVGSFGIGGTFSFYPTKNMSTGEGGMIVSDSTQYIESCKLLINHGSKERYVHEVLGYNYRMTNLAAAIGIEQLKKINLMNNLRRNNAKYFFEHIDNELVTLPVVHSQSYHVFHQFTIKTNHRNTLVNYLTSKGIGTGIYYPIPINKQHHIELYLKANNQDNQICPVSDQVANQVVSIPIHPALAENELKYICNSINNFRI